MMRVLFEFIQLLFKKWHKKKQPTIKAVNSFIVILNINKD